MLGDDGSALGRCDANAHACHDQDGGGGADECQARRAQPCGESHWAATWGRDGIGNNTLAQAGPGLRRFQLRVERGADFFLELAHQVMTCGTSTAGRNPCAAR